MLKMFDREYRRYFKAAHDSSPKFTGTHLDILNHINEEGVGHVNVVADRIIRDNGQTNRESERYRLSAEEIKSFFDFERRRGRDV
jgi:hypothetical protein